MLRYLLLKIIFTQHEICNSFEVHSVVVEKKILSDIWRSLGSFWGSISSFKATWISFELNWKCRIKKMSNHVKWVPGSIWECTFNKWVGYYLLNNGHDLSAVFIRNTPIQQGYTLGRRSLKDIINCAAVIFLFSLRQGMRGHIFSLSLWTVHRFLLFLSLVLMVSGASGCLMMLMD